MFSSAFFCLLGNFDTQLDFADIAFAIHNITRAIDTYLRCYLLFGGGDKCGDINNRCYGGCYRCLLFSLWCSRYG